MARGEQFFINTATEMSWLRVAHLPQVAAGTYKSAILYGGEWYPSRIELFKAKNPKATDTCVVYQKQGGKFVRAGISKPGIG
jgi:hypothetical protein